MLHFKLRKPFKMKYKLYVIIICYILFPFCHAQDKKVDIPIYQSSSKYRLVGKLGEPLGTLMTLQGIIIEGPHKGYEGGANIQVLKINGRATQENIRIKLYESYWGDFNQQKDIDNLKYLKTYEIRGFETGTYVGMPDDVTEGDTKMRKKGQTAGFYLRAEFEIYTAIEINKFLFTPEDFINRTMLLEGKAINKGKSASIIASNWEVIIDPLKPWPEYFVNKKVEAKGVIKQN